MYLYGTVNNRTDGLAKDLIQSNKDVQARPYNYTFVISNSNSYYYEDLGKNARYSLKPYYDKTFVVSKQKYQWCNLVLWKINKW